MIGIVILYALGIILIAIGIVTIVLAVLRSRSTSEDTKETVKAGGVIMIGPIPIIFGTDKKSVKTILLLSIALTVIVLITIIVSYLLAR